MLGLVIEDVANPFYSAIARGAEEVTRESGLLLITGSSDEDPARERELARLFCERRVDGLLIVPAGNDHRYLLPELRVGVPAVFIDRPPGNIEADVVVLDNVGGARAAAEYLLGQGHRRIAMVADDVGIVTQRDRWRGFRDALAAAGEPVDDTLVRFGVHDAATAERVAEELLSLASPPTAVFAANNRIAIGVLRMLAACGADVAVVGFDNLELAELLARPLTTVSYDPADLGRTAAELLVLRLEGDDRPPRCVILPTALLVRDRLPVMA
jgi:LacI family transcriptional regulator